MDNPICTNFRQLLVVGFSLAVGADIPEDLSQHSGLSGEKRSTSQSSIRNCFSKGNNFLVGSLILGTLIWVGFQQSSIKGNDSCFPTDPEPTTSHPSEKNQTASRIRQNILGVIDPTAKRTYEQDPKGKEIPRTTEDPKLIEKSTEFDSNSEAPESSDPKTSRITGNSFLPANWSSDFANWTSEFRVAAKNSDKEPCLSEKVKDSLQDILQFEKWTIQYCKPFTRTMGGENLFLRLTMLMDKVYRCTEFDVDYEENIPALILSDVEEEDTEIRDAVRSFEKFLRENFSKSLVGESGDHFLHSVSAVKTDDGERFLILWNTDINVGPIFVPFQDGCEIFEIFLAEMNPSESLEANDKKIFQALISSKRTNRKKVYEMPHPVLQRDNYIHRLLKREKTWKNGAFTTETTTYLPVGSDTASILLQEVLCIKTPGSIILNVGYNCDYISLPRRRTRGVRFILQRKCTSRSICPERGGIE